jgi:hypothetical protein
MAKHAKKMEKQDGALYLHVNHRRGDSRPGDGGESKRHGEKPAQIDARGRSQRAPQAKTPQGRPTAQRDVGGRRPSRSADDMNGGRENAAVCATNGAGPAPTAALATMIEIGRLPQ